MVKKATIEDIRILAEMAIQMWDSHSAEELATEFAETVNSENAAFFIKYAENVPAGFAQVGLRNDYVEGTETSPVGYLEGIFVKSEHRKKGYARELLSQCQHWAKEQGCKEFASDCELCNTESLKFHKAMGFEEVNRIICFKKKL
jgi:aminoglycoside 6'-N-acetyltransferase I